jgi:hypothetical protein
MNYAESQVNWKRSPAVEPGGPAILMGMKYTCPDSNCPPTDFPPVEVTSPEDSGPTVMCAGCSKTFPKGSIKPVR